jgi:hypothetical protein
MSNEHSDAQDWSHWRGDRAPFFPVSEDIMFYPPLSEASDKLFRFFINLLAVMNRQQTFRRDEGQNEIRLDWTSAASIAGCRRRDAFSRLATEAEHLGLLKVSKTTVDVTIHVCNWPELRGSVGRTENRRTKNREQRREKETSLSEEPSASTERPSAGHDKAVAREEDHGGMPVSAEFWADLRRRAAKHGGVWPEVPDSATEQLIRDRWADGADTEAFQRALDGYWIMHANADPSEFNAAAYFTPYTAFKAEKFSRYVQASYQAVQAKTEPRGPAYSPWTGHPPDTDLSPDLKNGVEMAIHSTRRA